MIYASLRRPIILPFRIRFLVRIVPIVLLLSQVHHQIFAIRCQTSAMFKGDVRADEDPNIDFFFYGVGRVGSFWMSDRAVCESIGMIPDTEWIDLASTVQNTTHPEIDIPQPKGTLELLWPLYKILSFSQFVEVFSCAMTGRSPAAETGMTLLEHSLAFAEAEALATRKTYRLETKPDETEDGEEPVPVDPRILKVKGEKIVPTEVLYIALISSLSHITSHVMALMQLQSRYRLLTTSIFGLLFLLGFALSLFHAGPLALLDFPTVSVVGFIPHLLILTGITICTSIYLLALLLTSLFPPTGTRSFTTGFHNLRANLTLQTLTISAHEDFYTTLLKLGFMCLTAASEATLLNESARVRMKPQTWLDDLAVPQYHPTPGRGPYAQERKDLRGVAAKTSLHPHLNTPNKWSGAAQLLRGILATVISIFTRPVIPAAARTHTPPPQIRAARPADTSALLMDSYDDDSESEFLPHQGTPETDDADEDDGWESEAHEDDLPLFTPSSLAQLLDPQTDAHRADARLLARHLGSEKIVTRAAYSRAEETLVDVLRERRHGREPHTAPEVKREETEEDIGGQRMPVCVVCLSAQRTIIMWPCRCLSLCEDCRVCLAMKNYRECVTCRQKMEGFSRIYVP